jgi:hypothetical protein
MTDNVLEFPGTVVEIEWTQDKVDEIHGGAFRDLEGRISDCAIMAHIAAGLAEPFIRDCEAEQALFAVCHVADMLKKLKADYEAMWYAEKVVAS